LGVSPQRARAATLDLVEKKGRKKPREEGLGVDRNVSERTKSHVPPALLSKIRIWQRDGEGLADAGGYSRSRRRVRKNSGGRRRGNTTLFNHGPLKSHRKKSVWSFNPSPFKGVQEKMPRSFNESRAGVPQGKGGGTEGEL